MNHETRLQDVDDELAKLKKRRLSARKRILVADQKYQAYERGPK